MPQDAFDIYHQVHETPIQTSTIGPALPALGHALAGSTGAAISNTITYPLSLIITRLQTQRQGRLSSTNDEKQYKSIADAFHKIYTQEGGVKGFYTGVLSDTTKTIADSFLFFLAYTFIRQQRLRSKSSGKVQLSVIDELATGFLAGGFAKLLTTPLANIVTRQQTSSKSDTTSAPTSTNSLSTVSIARSIHAEKGIQGFWSGYSASLVLTLNPSLTFFLYETFKRLLLPRSKTEKPPPSLTFLLSAISKVIASSITYPFSLAKARAQSSSTSPSQTTATKSSPTDPSNSPGDEKDTSKDSHPPHQPSTTIFSSLLQIARTDGLPALYSGLSGEVLKGFFSHGITMLLKQHIHTLIISLYYASLKLLKRWPTGEELAVIARERAQQAVDASKEGLENATGLTAENAREMAGQAGERAQDLARATASQALEAGEEAATAATRTLEQGKEAASRFGESAVGAASETADLVKDYVGNGEDGD